MAANARALKDIEDLMKKPKPGIILGDVENILDFDAIISGPPDTPYESGLFEVNVNIPETFPDKPPNVYMKTPVFHPNIRLETGIICVDILNEEWVPGIRLEGVLVSIQGLLQNPNPDSPLNIEAATMLRENQGMFRDTVKMWTHHFAGGMHTVPEMEEKLQILMAFQPNKKKALLNLSKKMWDVHRVLKKF